MWTAAPVRELVSTDDELATPVRGKASTVLKPVFRLVAGAVGVLLLVAAVAAAVGSSTQPGAHACKGSSCRAQSDHLDQVLALKRNTMQPSDCPTGYKGTTANIAGSGKQWSFGDMAACASTCDAREGCKGFEFHDKNGRCGTYLDGYSLGGKQHYRWLTCIKEARATAVFTVSNLDYYDLVADQGAAEALKKAVAETVATSIGVAPEDVTMALSPGSVKALVSISLYGLDEASKIADSIKKNGVAISGAIAVSLKAIESVMSHTIGDELPVSGPDVQVLFPVTPADSTPAPTSGESINFYPPNWPFLRQCLDPHSPGGFLNTSLPPCGAGQTSDFGKESRVAIVGAGPAGVSMARLLHDRGFRQIKLIESTSRVGGKSKRFEVNGEAHEMGTCYVAGKYECVEHWARMVGLTEINNMSRLVSSESATLMDMSPPKYGPVQIWTADYIFREFGISPQGEEISAAISKAAEAYAGHWAATMGQGQHMFPPADKVDVSAINRTFSQWLAARNLSVLEPVLTFMMSAQGYGPPNKVPAFYGLMWTHPNLLFGGSTFHGMFKEGFQELWERLLATAPGVVLSLQTETKSIRRGGSGVEITYQNGTTEQFDWLIMAAPMPRALALLSDVTEEERALFSSYNMRELVISMMNMSSSGSLPESFTLFSWADYVADQADFFRMSLDESGRVTRDMYDADGSAHPLLLRHDQNIKDSTHSVVATLQISDFSMSDDALSVAVQRGLQEYGIQGKLLTRERWDYMPHFSLQEVVEQRKPWRIWDLQGNTLTWWVGSHVSFESVADILDYNLQLLNSRLCSV